MEIDTRQRPVGAAFRVVAAAAGVAGLLAGLLFLGMDLTSGVRDPTGLVAAAVAAAGGAAMLVLLLLRTRALAWAVAAVTAVGGTAAGLLVRTEHLCCMFASVIERGYPFPWLTSVGMADDRETAMATARTAPLNVDWYALLGDLVFWGFAGLLLVLLVVAAGRALRSRAAARP